MVQRLVHKIRRAERKVRQELARWNRKQLVHEIWWWDDVAMRRNRAFLKLVRLYATHRGFANQRPVLVLRRDGSAPKMELRHGDHRRPGDSGLSPYGLRALGFGVNVLPELVVCTEEELLDMKHSRRRDGCWWTR